uniref:Ribonuclease A-domain domain-containing protein n=1 Tax=Sphenodon punctatus TaxID=8508 RepID=A0A8D0G6X9_SPHPU
CCCSLHPLSSLGDAPHQLWLRDPQYKKFLKQHYDNPRTNSKGEYCNTMMKKRGLTTPNCKETNSFIHATKTEIQAVCRKGGDLVEGNLRRSKKQLSVTTCKLSGGSPKPPCNYSENKSSRTVVLGCNKGLPVQFDPRS